MSNSTQWAVSLAIILFTFAGFVLGKASEPDLPRCAEGVTLKGIGDWINGRYPMYQCSATPVDLDERSSSLRAS